MTINKVCFLLFVALILSACCKQEIDSHFLPQAHHESLSKMATDKYYMECKGKAEFKYENFFTLPSGDLLVLIGIPDYLCGSNSVVPVSFNQDGSWNVGERLEGEASLFQAITSNSLWLSSHWIIEGVAPFLYHSEDGFNWRMVELPSPNNVSWPIYFLEQYCITDKAIAIVLAEDDENTQYFLKDFSKAESEWKQISLSEFSKHKQCIKRKFDYESLTYGSESSFPSIKTASKWIKHGTKNESSVVFQLESKGKKITVSFPRGLIKANNHD